MFSFVQTISENEVLCEYFAAELKDEIRSAQGCLRCIRPAVWNTPIYVTSPWRVPYCSTLESIGTAVSTFRSCALWIMPPLSALAITRYPAPGSLSGFLFPPHMLPVWLSSCLRHRSANPGLYATHGPQHLFVRCHCSCCKFRDLVKWILYSGVWRRVAWLKFTDVSEEKLCQLLRLKWGRKCCFWYTKISIYTLTPHIDFMV